MAEEKKCMNGFTMGMLNDMGDHVVTLNHLCGMTKSDPVPMTIAAAHHFAESVTAAREGLAMLILAQHAKGTKAISVTQADAMLRAFFDPLARAVGEVLGVTPENINAEIGSGSIPAVGANVTPFNKTAH